MHRHEMNSQQAHSQATFKEPFTEQFCSSSPHSKFTPFWQAENTNLLSFQCKLHEIKLFIQPKVKFTRFPADFTTFEVQLQKSPSLPHWTKTLQHHLGLLRRLKKALCVFLSKSSYLLKKTNNQDIHSLYTHLQGQDRGTKLLQTLPISKKTLCTSLPAWATYHFSKHSCSH